MILKMLKCISQVKKEERSGMLLVEESIGAKTVNQVRVQNTSTLGVLGD